MSHETALTRRRFLTAAVLTTGAAFVGDFGLGLSPAEASSLQGWSDPATWGGRVPGPGDAVVVDKAVLLDVDCQVAGVVIKPGGALYFSPDRSRKLTSTGNVVVDGLLQMRPATASVRHDLQFVGVDEARFVGGGTAVLASDVGLWSRGTGRLDLVGSPKTAWIRASATVVRGATTVQLAADPVGWRVGDELAIAPSDKPSSSTAHDAYDYATITAIVGRSVHLSRATSNAHPLVQVGPGVTLGTEVLNLTRNVNVAGTAQGRTHFTMLGVAPQQLAYLAVRHVGPRQAAPEFTKDVLGRYGPHFHMAGDASRGSKLVGLVVRDSGSHAYVAHQSHGIAFTSCISHDTLEDAYWYDLAFGRAASMPSNDLSYDSCVASRVRSDPSHRGYRLCGFMLGPGLRNRAVDCVAVGVQGNADASGFGWPEAVGEGVWGFSGCVAHNNKRNGIFVWQNSALVHEVSSFICYHNGAAGINHGAYGNCYQYTDGYLYGNAGGGVDLHSVSRSERGTQPTRFVRLHVDGAGVAAHGVRLLKHTLAPGSRTEVLSCTFVGHRGAGVAFGYDGKNGTTQDVWLDLVECPSSGPLLSLAGPMTAGSNVRVQSGQSAWLAQPLSAAPEPQAVVRDDWSARVSSVPVFSTHQASRAPRLFPRLGAPSGPAVGAAALVRRTTRAGALGTAAPGSSARHDSQPDMDVRRLDDGARSLLLITNASGRSCEFQVRSDGRTVVRGVAGLGLSRVEVPAAARLLSVVCHDGTYSWPL